jgi:hypothetical protein
VIIYVQFSSVGGRYGFGGGGLLFILGSNLGGVGPERGLRGGGRRVHMEIGSYFLFLQEEIKDIIISRTILLLHIIR